MKVALISVHGDPALQAGGKDVGGMNIYIREVAHRLRSEGIEIDIFTREHNRQEELEEEFEALNIIYINAGDLDIDKTGMFSDLDKFVEGVLNYSSRQNQSYELIYAHYWLSGVVAIELKNAWNVPVITSFHTIQGIKKENFPFNKDNQEREKQERIISLQSDSIIVWSSHEKKFIEQNFGVKPSKISVIPPGVDLDLFHPINIQEARRKIQMQERIRTILYVGRIERLKGLDMLLKALSQIHHEDTFLYIIGGMYNVEEVNRLKKICIDLNLNEKVHFIGSISRKQLKYYYNSADLHVLPSYYESFGLSVLESAACGKPSIASKVGGLPSIIRDNETGFLLEQRSLDSLIKKIEILLNDKELSETMGRAARKQAENLDWDIAINQLKNLFDKLTSK